jgi:pyruvate-formate lyase-activating enzyme
MTNEERIEILNKKRIAINNISPSFCTAKWLQTTLYLQNGYNHSCHHPSPHKIPIGEIRENPAALHNSKFKKEQRVKMLNGDRPSECDYCWKIEDLDKEYFSDRHYKTSDYWAWDRLEECSTSDPNKDITPSYLEVSFSNVCNFKCVYCSPDVSSKWMEEIERYGPYPTSTGNHDLTWLKQSGRFPYKQSDDNPYVDAFWKYLPEIYEKLRVLRVTGGEPLMSKDVWKLLEFIKLNPQPNLELAINTNLCVENKLIDKFINELNELTGKVKRIDVYTSIESSGIRAEYARYGLNYAQWQKNVRKILSETESTVGIMTTVNALSLSTTVDFLESIMQLRKEFNTDFANNRIPVSINYLRWPNHLSVNVLPTELRSSYALDISSRAEKWLKYYNADGFARLYLEEWDQVKRLCDYLSTVEPADPTDFIKFVDELDRRRGTNFYMTFPEYREFIQCQRNQTNH